jgi:hypothetical protein
MPLYIERHERGYSVYSGGYSIGGMSPHDTGPKPFWSWGARSPVGTSIAAGAADTPQEARSYLAASWRQQIAAVGLEEIPGMPKAIGSVAGSAPNSAHLDPFPYMLRRDFKDGTCVHPDDEYVAVHHGFLIGIFIQDPGRNWNPKVIREKWPKPWMWHIHLTADQSGIRLYRNTDTFDEARELHAVAWRRWLAWAGLREITSESEAVAA